MRSPFRVTVAVVLGTLLPSVSMALVEGYQVAPEIIEHSGWTLPHGYVAQTLTCSFDSLESCELFVGELGGGGPYQAAVYDEGVIVAQSRAVTPVADFSWIGFHSWVFRGGLARGRQYEFRFTRLGSVGINYFYRGGDPYRHGLLVVDGASHDRRNLAMRIDGVVRAASLASWGIEPMLPWHDSTQLRSMWLAKAKSVGVGAVRTTFDRYWMECDSARDYWFGPVDAARNWLQESAGCQLLAQLNYTPRWASTHFDSVDTAVNGNDTTYDTCWSKYCAPAGLWPGFGDTNYWAEYVESVVGYADDIGCNVHDWEVWNEPSDTNPDPPSGSNITGWWRRPNARDYLDSTRFGGLHGLALLYMRMAWLADSVICRPGTAHEHDRVLVGSVTAVNRGTGPGAVLGKEWLRKCYEVAGEAGWRRRWTGVSVHPYHNVGWEGRGGGFDPEEYQEIADTLRAIMRENGNADAQLWNTEIGWDTIGEDTCRNARSLFETFVSAKASEVLPQGGYDRAFWWLFRETGHDSGRCGHFPLLDSAMRRPYMSYYAFGQMTRQLTSKRFSRRVIQGGARDDAVRVYEFEHPATLRRTWVCWKNGGMDSAVRVEVRIPAMTDRLTAESLAYRDGRPPGLAVRPGTDGWLSLSLGERPVFISELDVPKRPDLVVDSVRVVSANPRVGESMTVRVWLRNHGTRATPQRHATRVLFTADGDSIGGAEVSRGIAVGQTVPSEFLLSHVPPGTSGPVLFAATVNPEQRYVELDIDNNAGYTQAVIE